MRLISAAVPLSFLLVGGEVSAQSSARGSQRKQPTSSQKAIQDTLQWRKAIDHVLLRLERVEREDNNLVFARNPTALADEETRLKAVAREQETQARAIVAELRSGGYTRASTLDSLVKAYTDAFALQTGYVRMFIQYGDTPETKGKVEEFAAARTAALQAIRELRP